MTMTKFEYLVSLYKKKSDSRLESQLNRSFLVLEGPDTKRIFEEIDLIRRKQIELAAEHIALESIDDMS
jgi:hypothetical protein